MRIEYTLLIYLRLKSSSMLSLILWLSFIGFFGGSIGGRHIRRGIVFFITFHIGLFSLYTNFTHNKICTLITLEKTFKLC